MSGWPAGTGLRVLDSIDSTNEEAGRLSLAGETGPIWIAARRQLAGRDRMGRPWSTAPGNLAATLLLPFRGTPAEAARLGFPASLAVVDLLDRFAPGVPVALKWPNDVLLAGRKASGILLENFGPGPDGRLRLAIGIGVNLAHYPQPGETRWPATSVAAETGAAPDFDAALTELAARFDPWLAVLARDGFDAVRTAWLARADRLGQPIEARLPRGTLAGRFAEIDADGALVLETADGTRRIAAGEVHWPVNGEAG
ncbi:MAG TPA: biotin--[acetyl-CoA-carboxylase] ligase [Paracoccaceae bacterium]|nr:biotin--[acetyl-CoA-carboxylase] ligase [Paracoccaceae bacterium]